MNTQSFPELSDLLKDCDHVDVKTVESTNDMRAFIAGMLNYAPRWMVFLFRVRGVLARLLGLRHEDSPGPRRWEPDEIPFKKGASLSFFTIYDAKPDRHYIAYARDTHLVGYLAIIAERLPDAVKPWRYHVVTIVKYQHWTGPVYFNVIRPFHHIVVHYMAAAGAKS